MLPVFLALMAIYVLLLVFVLQGRWSSLKFAGFFKRAILMCTSAGMKEQEDESSAKPSVTHGYSHGSSIFSKNKSGRPTLRQSPIQLYSDNGYFTSLTVEKKESLVRTQDETNSFPRERGELKARIQRLKGQNSPVINLELADEVYNRKRDLKYNNIEAYLAFRNGSSSTSGGSRQSMVPHQLGTSPKRPSEGRIPILPLQGSTGKKKLRLSRGFWAKSRRRNFISRVDRKDLSIIPERDESEERASTNVSSTHFKCQANDSRTETESSAVC